MDTVDRPDLVRHLVHSRIAGEVATPRENNLLHYRLMADRDPHYLLGLDPSPGWSAESVLELMVRRVGVGADPRRRFGVDTIDPELVADALERYADRLAGAALRRETVLLATGHPASLARAYQSFADALRGYGCRILCAGAGWSYEAPGRYGPRRLTVGYTGDVAALEDAEGPVHSHSPRPIRATFAALAEAGHCLPDLVIADHGWCGGAAQAGADAVGFADCNDPALFVGEAEGVVRVAVPLDDGLAPELYDPLADYVLARVARAVRVVTGS
ncbi:phosphatase [Actinospica durhamensis]|uniref:Phosphatase n=1 Tax=Actinospica durhamensis TaxID=1508375 RepID=A0A941EJ15_9ACTN|nr:phosphatase [Actinospica durhamensis]MBR7832291.1 phosphatase [Actinospica durhamensis]